MGGTRTVPVAIARTPGEPEARGRLGGHPGPRRTTTFSGCSPGSCGSRAWITFLLPAAREMQRSLQTVARYFVASVGFVGGGTVRVKLYFASVVLSEAALVRSALTSSIAFGTPALAPA